MPHAVPVGWDFLKLTEVARLESGHTPSRKHPEYWDGSIPWVSLHDTKVLNKPLILETAQTIGELGLANSSARLLPAGTVVFSRTATVGKATILGREMATSQDFANYVCGPRVYNGYLLQLFRFLQPEWNRLMAGSTHNTIYMPVFENLQVLLPSLGEQRKIAAILSSVDDAIEATQAVIDQLQVVKKATMAELLTRGLPGRHTHFEQTEIGEVPADWMLVTIDSLGPAEASTVRSGPFGSSMKTKDFRKEGTPVLTIQSLGEGAVLQEGLFYVDDAKTAELAEYRVRPNDLVFSRVADIGRCVAIEEAQHGWLISPNLSRIRLDPSKADARFLMYSLTADSPVRRQIEMIAGSAGRPVISSGTLKSLRLPLPPIEEQRGILAAGRECERRLEAEAQTLDTVRSLKSALMSVLLTGEVRVTPAEAAA